MVEAPTSVEQLGQYLSICVDEYGVINKCVSQCLCVIHSWMSHGERTKWASRRTRMFQGAEV